MRYMIIVKATKDSEAGVTLKGWRVRYRGADRTVVDGPFAETKELIAGYTIIQVKSRAEAVEWTRKFPNPTLDGADCEIEVRRMFELEDFGDTDTLDRFREIGLNGEEKRP